MWFNDTNSSTWYFLPGLIMLILTIVGVFLTSLVMAREWERGTLEAIFVTPVHDTILFCSDVWIYFVFNGGKISIQAADTWFIGDNFVFVGDLSVCIAGNRSFNLDNHEKSIFIGASVADSEFYARAHADWVYFRLAKRSGVHFEDRTRLAADILP